MSDVQQQALAQGNGHAASLSVDERIVEEIRAQADVLEARRAELQSQLDEITPQLQRYQKAIKAILGEPLRHQSVDPETGEPVERKKPGPKPGSHRGGTTHAGVSEGQLAMVERVFRELATQRDDVRQVDVRTVTGLRSGSMALAFKELRNRGVIRLARVDGNNKYFRLTRGDRKSTRLNSSHGI